ncbi:MAG: hypothetical protein KGI60_04460 [Patescibacteria group bacterium]|nr:hypothetical protein [Patescibacteria group bacterium]
MVHITKQNGVVGRQEMHSLGTERSRPDSAAKLFLKTLKEGYSVVSYSDTSVTVEKTSPATGIRIGQVYEGSALDMKGIVLAAKTSLTPARA